MGTLDSRNDKIFEHFRLKR